MERLTVEDLLIIAEEAIGEPAVRDIGLLDSAAHRPQASAFGKDAYPTIDEKAAALLEAVVRNHALVDGDKRLAWSAAVVLYDLNGFDLDPPTVDEAVDLVIEVATGQVDLPRLTERLASWAHQR
ncbi:MAG TPA: type II toxin-antitoxin system death-on-curing family toxin [Actinomycetes bacterium]|jgi:death-on-curing protein|nr:type II toxin-antitoxin system death-on-curing family toxin [Actinomycetes bacterium]